MKIRLKKNNVIKEVYSELEALAYTANGFKIISKEYNQLDVETTEENAEADKPPAPKAANKTAKGNSKAKGNTKLTDNAKGASENEGNKAVEQQSDNEGPADGEPQEVQQPADGEPQEGQQLADGEAEGQKTDAEN